MIDFHQFGTPGKFRLCHYSCTLLQDLIPEVENVRFNKRAVCNAPINVKPQGGGGGGGQTQGNLTF